VSDYGQSTGGIGGTLARVARGAVHPNLLLNVVGPLGVYQVLTGRGVSAVDALLVAAVFPVAAILVGVLRNRRLEPLGALSLLAIGLGVLGALVFDDPRFLLVKDSAVTGLLGIACLGSLLGPRPLLFVIGRQFVTAGDPEKLRRYDASWESEEVRASSRRVTFVWGIAFVAEASVRVGLSYVLAPATLLAVSPLLALGVFGPLGLWTLRGRARWQAVAGQ
jgi:hypothetical protein